MVQARSVETFEVVDRPSMIVLADTCVLTAADLPDDADPAVTNLCAHGIPLVLASELPGEVMREWQRRLGIRHPYISDGGRTLHVPTGYFGAGAAPGPVGDDWQVIDVTPPEPAPSFAMALGVLLGLYWSRRGDGLVVGITDRHTDLIEAADVQIIVANPALDQRPLCARAPAAYVTNASGCAGWTEGILGALAE